MIKWWSHGFHAWSKGFNWLNAVTCDVMLMLLNIKRLDYLCCLFESDYKETTLPTLELRFIFPLRKWLFLNPPFNLCIADENSLHLNLSAAVSTRARKMEIFRYRNDHSAWCKGFLTPTSFEFQGRRRNYENWNLMRVRSTCKFSTKHEDKGYSSPVCSII